MRWADLDLLGHVNNVTYLNYLREARVDFFATLGRTVDIVDLCEGIRITRNKVVFAAPLLFRPRPVTVELWTSDIGEHSFALNYEIVDKADDTDQDRIVYVRVRAEVELWTVGTGGTRALTLDERSSLSRYGEDAIELSPMAEVASKLSLPAVYDLTVRLSDLDIYRRVSDVIYFEYFQEARVAYLYDLEARADNASELVIARTDIAYHQPVTLRREPYRVRSGVVGVGTKSFTVVSQILDGATVAATAHVVLVGFDSQRQAAAPLTTDQRAALVAELNRAVQPTKPGGSTPKTTGSAKAQPGVLTMKSAAR